MAQDRSIKILLKADIAEFKRGMDEAAKATKGTKDELEKAATKQQAWGRAAVEHSTALIAFGAGLEEFARRGIMKFADFDQAMSNVAASGADARDNIEALNEAALQFGADTAYNAVECANAINELAKAGLDASQILGGALAGSLDLAASEGMAVAEAAAITATSLQQFHLEGEKAVWVADLLAAGAGKAMGSAHDLGEALGNAGVLANQMGISVKDSVGTLAAFAQYGIIGAEAGTAMKSMLMQLLDPSNKAAGMMEELGIQTNNAQGEFIGMAGLAGELKNKMSDLTQEERNHAMAVIFGSYAVRAAGVLFDEGAEGIQNWINAVDDWGYASMAAQTKMDNLKGDLEKLGGTFETIAIQSGSGLNTALRGIVQTADNLLSTIGQLPGWVLSSSLAFTGLTGVALIGLGTFGKLVKTINDLTEAEILSEGAAKALSGSLGTLAKMGGVVAAAAAIYAIEGALFDTILRAGKDLPSAGKLLNLAQSYTQTMRQVSQSNEKAALTSSVVNRMFSIQVDSLFGATQGAHQFAEAMHNSDTGFTGLMDKFTRPVSNSPFEVMEQQVGQVSHTLAEMVNRGYGNDAARMMQQIRAEFESAGWDDTKIKQFFSEYYDAVDAAANKTEDLKIAIAAVSDMDAKGIDEAADYLERLGDEGQKAFEKLTALTGSGEAAIQILKNYGIAGLDIFNSYSNALAQTAAHLSNNNNAWDIARGEAEKPPSFHAWLNEMHKQATAFEEFQANTEKVSERIREKLPADMQEAAVAMLAAFSDNPLKIEQLLSANDTDFADAVETYGRLGESAGNSWAKEFTTELLTIAPQFAEQFANTVMDVWDGRFHITPEVDETSIETWLAETSNAPRIVDAIQVNAKLDQGQLVEDLTDVKLYIDHTSGTVEILGDDGKAIKALTILTEEIDAATGEVKITAMDNKGREVFFKYKTDVEATPIQPQVDPRLDAANQKMTAWLNEQHDKKAEPSVKPRTEDASSAIDNWIRSQSDKTITVKVQQSFTGADWAGYARTQQPNRATGGPLSGFPTGGFLPGRPPANEFEDNILGVNAAGVPVAMVQSGEFITRRRAAEYYGPLMWAINSMQIPREYLAALLRGGLPRHATGGIAGKSVEQLANEVIKGVYGNGQARKDALGSSYAAVQSLVNQKLGATSSGTKTTSSSASVSSGPSAADLAAAEEARRKAEEAQKKAEAEAKARQKEIDTLLLQIQRGQVIEQGSNSLSGAQSLADRLRAMGANDALGLSDGVRTWLNQVAAQQEATFTSLFKQVEALDAKLKEARDKVQELASIKASASSAIMQGFRLADAATATTDSVVRTANNGNSIFTFKEDVTTPATGASMLAKAEAFASKVQTFASKLSQLQGKGFGGAILQEVAGMGVEAGIPAADALLSLSSSETTRFNNAYKSIEQWAGYAGDTVTKGFYTGGIAAAEGLVAGLDSQKAAIQKAIEQVAATMQATLKSALGIASPSKVFRQLGQFTGQGLALGMDDMRDAVAYSAANLVALPPAIFTNNQMSAGAGNSGAGVVQNIEVNYPVNEPISVALNKSLQYAAMIGI